MSNKNTDNKIPIYKLTSKKRLIEYYDKWVIKNQYNKDMVDWNYVAPKNTVDLFEKYITNKKIKILDAGCGTGLVGIELLKRGFSNLIGVDFSKSMLELIPNGVYKSISLIDLNKTLDYQNDYFDSIICVGTFTYGHVRANTLNEFVRITKNNGFICFTVNEGIYKKNKFDKKIKELEKNKNWKILKLIKSSYIINKDVSAWLCISKVNKLRGS